MRCKSCDRVLNDREATRKSQVTKEYIDMCDHCLHYIIDDIQDSIDPEDDIWDEDVLEEEAQNEEDL